MSETPFIEARPRKLDRLFWGRYFSLMLKRHFAHGYMFGEQHLLGAKSATDGIPTIVVSTHASWWDAAVAMSLAWGRHSLDMDGMMEYKQLTRYRFFSRLGIFSVVREDASSAMRSLRYGAGRIRDSNRMLWMYPQGELIHQDVARIECEPGIGILSHLVGTCRILPVAMRYELLREQRPACWVRFDEPLVIESGAPIRHVQAICSDALTNVRDSLRSDAMRERHDGYESFISGRLSMEKRFDALLGRRPYTER
jgi:1-acyl-sn-glycerol-3-phosphate acyltransferase